MNIQLLKEGLLWGVVLWLIGYVLGFIFFAFMPTSVIGWVIMPFGVAVTLWVLFKYVKGDSFLHYFLLGVIWTVIAIVLDYFLLVQLLKPADGYYKLDVYLYYASTLVLPMVAWWLKKEGAVAV